ncbi:hypothetical protein PybrP1_011584, partial [[Pythium] brassicae (nom. inval.)]
SGNGNGDDDDNELDDDDDDDDDEGNGGVARGLRESSRYDYRNYQRYNRLFHEDGDTFDRSNNEAYCRRRSYDGYNRKYALIDGDDDYSRYSGSDGGATGTDDRGCIVANSRFGRGVADPTQSKKARRKEQCRVNQANYRKRKRMYEDELSSQIKALELEVVELKARRRTALRQQQQQQQHSKQEPRLAGVADSAGTDSSIDNAYNVGNSGSLFHCTATATATATAADATTAAATATATAANAATATAFTYECDHRESRDPIQRIGDFYDALERKHTQYALPHDARLHYRSVHTLFEPQQHTFASMDALLLQWMWYREHFVDFRLVVTSSERLDVGDQVIIRISAQLHLQLPSLRSAHAAPQTAPPPRGLLLQIARIEDTTQTTHTNNGSNGSSSSVVVGAKKKKKPELNTLTSMTIYGADVKVQDIEDGSTRVNETDSGGDGDRNLEGDIAREIDGGAIVLDSMSIAGRSVSAYSSTNTFVTSVAGVGTHSASSDFDNESDSPGSFNDRVLTHITSEVDWTACAAAMVQYRPEPTLALLRELADEVSARWS